jgi:hypothetical protein
MIGMICSACLRNVPKLIGRDQLCPECFSAASADLIPEVFEGILEGHYAPEDQHSLEDGGWGGKFPECETSYAPEFACGCVGDELEWSTEGELFEGGNDGEGFPSWKEAPEEFPPCFKGWPRF